MKTFIYTERNNKNSTVEVSVYQIKRNNPELIGKLTYTKGSTLGADSEVLNYLIENKYIPKSYYNLSENEWRGAGYYCNKVLEKGVRIIGLI